ncbi:MAG: flagellar assembly protein FliW [Gemmatimonadaceae bacterium]
MSTTLERPSSALVNVASEVLGTLQVPRQELIEFPAGVFGFPAARTWSLLPTLRESVFWLQSTEYSALAFVLVNPFVFFPGEYQIDLTPFELSRLGAPLAQDLLILAIVTMPSHSGESCTANLHAPVVFNLRDRQAWQTIRSDDGFSVRAPFDIDRPVSAAAQ